MSESFYSFLIAGLGNKEKPCLKTGTSSEIAIAELFGLAKKPSRIGLMGEFWLGTQLGLLWTPCAGPVLGGIIILAAVNHQVVAAFWLLVAYGIGAGLPLLVIAYGGRILTQRILNLRSHSAALQRIGGVAIMATAIAILLGWDVQVQLWLAPFFPTQPL